MENFGTKNVHKNNFGDYDHDCQFNFMIKFNDFLSVFIHYYFFVEKESMSRSVIEQDEAEEKPIYEKSPLPAAVVMQFLLLYKRNLLTTKRGYVSSRSC